MNRKVFPLELYRRVLKRAKLDEDFYHAIISEYIELLDEHYELHNLEESVTDWEGVNMDKLLGIYRTMSAQFHYDEILRLKGVGV